jgi:thymidylate synthase (FAD)
MRVIPASFKVLDELDQQSLLSRIEAGGRVCYKSEDKIGPESAAPFVRAIIKHGHNSVMEMGVLTLRVAHASDTDLAALYAVVPKYLFIDRLADHLLITGSVRAFRELAICHSQVKLVRALVRFLISRHPQMFFDIEVPGPADDPPEFSIEKVPLAEVDRLTDDLKARHRHLAVKFYVNRAVTHEIVRHRPCSYLQESQRYCRYSENKFDNQVTFIKPMFFKEGSDEYKLWEKAMSLTEEIYLKLLATSSPQAARTVLPNSCKTELIAYANLVEWRHIFRLRTSPGAEPSMREVMDPLLKEFKKRFASIFADIKPAV